MQTTQRIEGYDSFELVAVEGTATLYRARQLSLDRTVAVTVFSPHLSDDRRFIERFQSESSRAAKIRHENLVNVVDYGKADGACYVVAEYCDGVSLGDLLGEQAAIPLDVGLALLLNACYGLEAAHSENLVHGSITPASVICTHRGGVKVDGFGVVEAAGRKRRKKDEDRASSTPSYTSPEQTKGDPAGPQSDIFSLGVVAYEIVCGKHPFDGPTRADVVDRIRSREPSPASSINPLVGKPLSSILGKMLRKPLSERYEHVSELVMDLEEAIEKHKYRRDRRLLEEYILDPSASLDRFKFDQLEKLMAKPPPPESGNNEARTLYFRQILHLNPEDARARRELESPSGTDPGSNTKSETPSHPAESEGNSTMEKAAHRGASKSESQREYRVILESIDRDKETPETFALKLSMSIRSPLPRVNSIVKNMPAAVGERMSYKQAKHLAGLLQELGGRSRIDAHAASSDSPRENARTRGHEKAEPNPQKAAASAGSGPVGHGAGPGQPAGNESLDQKPSAQTCPKCGWEGDAGAKFCPTCSLAFKKDEGLNPVSEGFASESENPLADQDDYASAIDRFLALSGLGRYVKPAILLVLICILLSLLSDL